MMMAYSYVAAAASSMSLESRKSYLAYVYACLDRSMDRVQCNAMQCKQHLGSRTNDGIYGRGCYQHAIV